MSTDENYFSHVADIGIIGKGETLEKCFANAAYVMFALMADLSAVKPQHKITVEFEESDIELAFVTWLNQLLAQSYELNIIFSKFSIKRSGDQWQGEAFGDVWRNDIEKGIEVKGATLTMLSVKQIDGGWEGRCVVDV